MSQADGLTNKVSSTSIADSMEDPNQTTRIPNGLFIPYHRLALTLSFILGLLLILLEPVCLVGPRYWKYEKKSVGGTGNEGEEVWIFDAEHVVEL